MRPRIHPTAVIGEIAEHREVIWAYYRGEDVPLLYPEIDPTAIVGAYVTIDAGVENPTRIGARTLLMKHAHIGHDAQVGEDCELAPGTVIAGHVTVGSGVRFGVNSCVRPFITIGHGARIGAGAVVVKDVPAGEVWVGNPARKLRGVWTGEVLTPLEVQGWEELASA